MLEPYLRTKRYPQVVVRSVGEVDGIANFSAQAEWTPEAFESRTWVNREVSTRTANARNRVADVARSHGRIAFCEVDESNLAGHKELERTRRLEFRAKQTGKRTQPRGRERGASAVICEICEVALKVVVHFAFDCDVAIGVETSARAETDEIRVGVRGRREAEVVRKDSDAPVVIISVAFLRGQPRRRGQQDAQDCEPKCAFHGYLFLPPQNVVPPAQTLEAAPVRGAGEELDAPLPALVGTAAPLLTLRFFNVLAEVNALVGNKRRRFR